MGQLARREYDEVHSYFEAVVRNVDRLEHLSNDLLDMQRIETGRMTIEKIPISLSSIVESLKSEMTPLLNDKDQSLEIVIPDKEVTINCDSLRVLQVLINLVQNSYKFSEYGDTIKVIVSLSSKAALFTVVDTGIGLAKKDISKLFTPFPDIHITNVRHGSGLGLSICKGIIELHGGKIWVESDGIGTGASFSFTIPR